MYPDTHDHVTRIGGVNFAYQHHIATLDHTLDTLAGWRRLLVELIVTVNHCSGLYSGIH